MKPNQADTTSPEMWHALLTQQTGRGWGVAGYMIHRLIVVCVGFFFALFRARMEKICRIAPLGRIVLIRADTASPTTWCAGLRHRIGWDDMAGSWQDKRQIDCRVGWLFPLILREDGKNLSYSPHRSNRTDSSGHRVAHNAVRGFEALGWAGEGHGWRDKPPI